MSAAETIRPSFIHEHVKVTVTSDPAIVSVNGASTDPLFIKALGELGDSILPKGAKYYQFEDGVTADVIQKRGAPGEYVIRAPKGTNSTRPSKPTLSALEQANLFNQSISKQRAELKSKIEGEIAELREKQAQMNADLEKQIADSELVLAQFSANH